MSVTPLTDGGEVLRIGEVARRAGVTTRTLRYWGEIGLVKPSDRRGSGERVYSLEELERVIHVRELQELLGLTLAEIHIVLASEDAVERARRARRANASAVRMLELIDSAIEAHSRLIERMDDRLARTTTFRDEWVQRGQRMRARAAELRAEQSDPAPRAR